MSPEAIIEEQARALDQSCEQILRKHFPRTPGIWEGCALGYFLGVLEGSALREQSGNKEVRTIVATTLKQRYGYTDHDVAHFLGSLSG